MYLQKSKSLRRKWQEAQQNRGHIYFVTACWGRPVLERLFGMSILELKNPAGIFLLTRETGAALLQERPIALLIILSVELGQGQNGLFRS